MWYPEPPEHARLRVQEAHQAAEQARLVRVARRHERQGRPPERWRVVVAVALWRLADRVLADRAPGPSLHPTESELVRAA